MMETQPGLTTPSIHALFAEEITALGGSISDVFQDEDRLFLRSILPKFRHVREDDQVQCGVALRVLDDQVKVHPYVFRLVCKNGAIWAHALQTCTLENVGSLSPERVEVQLREAIRACGSEEAFETATQEMRTAQDAEADLLLTFLPMLSHFPAEFGRELLKRLLENQDDKTKSTRYSLMNVLTAIARDTEDPEQRWQLEEWGKGVLREEPIPIQEAGAARELQYA